MNGAVRLDGPLGCGCLLLLWIGFCAAVGATLAMLDWLWSMLP